MRCLLLQCLLADSGKLLESRKFLHDLIGLLQVLIVGDALFYIVAARPELIDQRGGCLWLRWLLWR